MTKKATKTITVDPVAPDGDELAAAAQTLREDGLVAFPTETVYGLGARALSPTAVQKIFAAKGRPATNPLIVHVASVEEAKKLAGHWPDVAQKLADAFWPGPLTLVVSRSDIVPDAVCAGRQTVAIRMPAHPVAKALIQAVGEPLAAPSANRYTEVSPTTAEHVVTGLGGRIEMVIDGGATTVGVESTLVSVMESPPVVLRPGMISTAQLSEIVDVKRRKNIVVDESESRPSPGLSRRHYSPKAVVRVVDSTEFLRLRQESKGRRFIGLGERANQAEESDLLLLPPNPEGYARRLYAALHRFDDGGVEAIIVEAPPRGDRWDAIWDRLRRAAH